MLTSTKFFPNQHEIYTELIKSISKYTDTIYVEGPSGCGKSFLIKHLDAEYLLLEGEFFFDDREYYPFHNSFNRHQVKNYETIRNLSSALIKDVPYGANSIEFLINKLFKKNKYSSVYLNQIEKEIVAKLMHIVKKGTTLFIVDNLQWWDQKSLELLYIIFIKNKRNYFNKLITLIIFTTTNQLRKNTDIISNILTFNQNSMTLSFRKLTYSEFKNFFLENGILYNFNEKQLSILFNLVDSHLRILITLIKEIKENKFTFDTSNISALNNFNNLLVERLKVLGTEGKKIENILEYASLIGSSFSSYELEQITQLNEIEFKKIVEHTNSLHLTEVHGPDKLRFAHEVIRTIFNNKIEGDKKSYYKNLEACLAVIKPSLYFRRANYCLLSGDKDKSEVLYALHILYKIIKLGSYDLSFDEPIVKGIKNIEIIKYLKYMLEAYSLFSKKKYAEVLHILDYIDNYLPNALLAEKYILESQCYTKFMLCEERIKAIEHLKVYCDILYLHGEIAVRERVLLRMMSAYSHLADFSSGISCEKQLYESLSSRAKYDEDALDMLHVVRSRSAMLHNCEITLVNTEKAYSYFKVSNNTYGLPKDLRQFYISIVNYSCALISNGYADEGYKIAKEGIDLLSTYSLFDFPRQQILYNNYAIAGLLNGSLKLRACIKIMEDLITPLPTIAERLTYVSNLSIMYAISGKVKKGYGLLKEEYIKQNANKDVEGIYKYRAKTNLILYEYLLNHNTSLYTYFDELNPIINRLTNRSYYNKKNSILRSIIKDNKEFEISLDTWQNQLFRYCSNYQGSPWNFYGVSFAIAPLYCYTL